MTLESFERDHEATIAERARRFRIDDANLRTPAVNSREAVRYLYEDTDAS